MTPAEHLTKLIGEKVPRLMDWEIEGLVRHLMENSPTNQYERVGVYRWSGGFQTDELAVIENGEVLYKVKS